MNSDLEESLPPSTEENSPNSSVHEKEAQVEDQVDSGRPSQPSLLPAFAANLTRFTTVPATKAPKEALKAVYDAGKYKAGLKLDVLIVQSVMAGIFIGMAGNLFLAVGGGILGAALFPTGLMAVVLTSAELFTGDALIFVAGLLGGKVTLRSLLRNWTVAWLFNFAGCLMWAYFVAYLSEELEDEKDYAIKIALKKADQPWGHIVLKGMAANFMVCLGVWQATCAEEVAGKILALWFPITGFVAMGFDHCIANQFLIPVGMMYGADISISHLLFRALLPATLGNVIGGGFFIGAVYWYVFDSMNTAYNVMDRIHIGRRKTQHRLYDGGNRSTSMRDSVTRRASRAVKADDSNV